MLAALFAASVWAALASALVAAVASVLFLRTRNLLYDALGLAATETGVLLLTAGIVAGAAAGRMAAGLWWTWDASLTAALVCFLLYAPYLMLRKAIEEPSRRAASAAVVSLFAVFDVPLIGIAIHWWLARRGGSIAMGASWYIAPVVLLGAALAWMRLTREQRRRAEDAARRTAQEI